MSRKRVSQGRGSRLCHALVAALAVAASAVQEAQATSKASIVVPDLLCLPGEEVWVEAFLYREGMTRFFRPEVQGEVLRFVDEHRALLDTRLTDATGMARIRFQAGKTGHLLLGVSLSENPRCQAEPATGHVFVRQKTLSLFFVLIEGALVPVQPVSLFSSIPGQVEPVTGSVDRTRQIAARATLVYLTQLPVSRLPQMRQWLEERRYPPAALLSISRAVSELPGSSAPELGKLESLWEDRSLPACLVTKDTSLAAAAAEKGFRVYLLEEAGAEPESGKADTEKGVTRARGWDQIPPGCPDRRKGKTKR